MAAPPQSRFVPVPLAQWWRGKSARERRIVAVVAGIALMGALWTLAWQPLARDLAAMRAGQAQRIATLAEARRMAGEMAELARSGAPVVPVDDRAALERVLAQYGLRAAATELAWQDARARIVFGAVGFDALVTMLEALQRDAHLRVIEATLTARVEPGTVRAELTLAR
jgi:general secretion pathway protein M